ncbi:DUF5908 family protein [Christiangramia crocea]|uniref:DUF5908 family protein n=1 Tax=Christiangramia crocea TaxID=2904124 RepID=A0A9X1UZQ7_9FLAO|nr:DUF5908 family protein [Gramella crocea]MCG9972589.1 DUF5908 family protein [Gramella crocea]
MPVEINELHIKIQVAEDTAPGERKSKSQIARDKEELVQACVEAVMEIIELKKQR